MKKIIKILLAFTVLLFAGCSGSGTYRGPWKATNANGEKLDINFDEKSFTVKDASGAINNFDYTQNSVSIENGVETYGIVLKDGRKYFINFPIANDESKGIIKDGAGQLQYVISKTDYITHADIFKLQ